MMKITFLKRKLLFRSISVFLMSLSVNFCFSQLGNSNNLFVSDNGSLYVASGNLFLGASSVTETTKITANHGLIMLGETATVSGAVANSFVDGYVRTYKLGSVIIPVGDAGERAEVMVFPSANFGVDVAYFRANPSSFGTALSGEVTDVSDIEYWDVSGAPITQVSLSWRASSGIATLTENNLNNLIMVGWNGSVWQLIPATVDATAFFGGASTFSQGSITSNAAFDLTQFEAITLAAKNTLSASSFNGGIQTIILNNGLLEISTLESMEQLTVYDVTGRVVESYKVNQEVSFKGNFNHSAGVYILNVKYTNGTTVTRKLINK